MALRLELLAVLAVARKEIRSLRRYPLQAANVMFQPLYQSLIPSFLLGSTFLVAGRAVGFEASSGSPDFAGFLFLGAAVAGLIAASFWGAGFAFRLETMSGTLEPAWLTPTRRSTFVLGYCLSSVALTAAAGFGLLVIGAIAFGARFLGAAITALPALVLAEVGLVGVTYLVSSVVLLMRDPNFFVDSTNFIFSALSGSTFPIAVLPTAVKVVAFLLPTTYALDLVRQAALGTRPLMPPWAEYAAMAALAVTLLCLGLAAFHATERYLRRTGNLSQY